MVALSVAFILFSREIFLGVSTISVQIYVEYRYTQNRMADGKKGCLVSKPLRRKAGASGTPRARNQGRTRPTARDTRQSHRPLSRSLLRTPETRGRRHRRPRKHPPPSRAQSPLSINNDTRPRAVEMHPAWMDTERGSENAKSEPQKIPRPSPPARAPPTNGSLLRSLFSLSPPDESSRMKTSDSFGRMPFVGGEEEAHDHWHDKWEAHRRTSLEESTRERDAIAVVGAAGGGVPQVKRAGLAAPGDVYKVASSAALAGASAPRVDESKTTQKASPYGEDIYKSTFWG